MSRRVCAYHDLLGFCEVVLRVPVQLHLAQFRDGHEFLGHDLCWIEEVEAEPELVVFIHDLHAQLDYSVPALLSLVHIWKGFPTSHSGYRPASIASYKSCRIKSAFFPETCCASSHT